MLAKRPVQTAEISGELERIGIQIRWKACSISLKIRSVQNDLKHPIRFARTA
ncbi:hypothetical protein D3C84_1280970 [compost metagenome]